MIEDSPEDNTCSAAAILSDASDSVDSAGPQSPRCALGEMMKLKRKVIPPIDKKLSQAAHATDAQHYREPETSVSANILEDKSGRQPTMEQVLIHRFKLKARMELEEPGRGSHGGNAFAQSRIPTFPKYVPQLDERSILQGRSLDDPTWSILRDIDGHGQMLDLTEAQRAQHRDESRGVCGSVNGGEVLNECTRWSLALGLGLSSPQRQTRRRHADYDHHADHADHVANADPSSASSPSVPVSGSHSLQAAVRAAIMQEGNEPVRNQPTSNPRFRGR